MNAKTRKLSYLILLAATIFGATACNTMHGVGKDVEKGGEKIQKEADEHRDHD